MELRRQRSDLAGGEAKVDRLRSQPLDWKQKCISAVPDRDVIRIHLVQLDSGTLRLSSGVPSAVSATPPTHNKFRSTEPDLPIKGSCAAKMTRSGTN